jgi:hypothetical protein
MSINKSFVVKNGFEASTNLILADADTRKVGVGTTAPQYTLHVNGGIGATDLYVSGIATAGAYYGDGSNLTFNTPITLSGLVVSGVSTLGVTTATHLNVQSLNVSGIGTIFNSFITNLAGTAATITTFNSTNGSITNLTGTAATITTISSTNGTITNLTGTAATITNLTGTAATITTFNSTNGSVTNLTGTAATITNLTGTAATITTFNSTNGSITNLTGTAATITTFNSTNGSVTNLTGTAATITTLSSTNGTITNLTGTAATITTISSTNGTITNLTGTAATIGTVQISSGIITATSGIVTYFGDGSKLTNILSGVGVATAGGTVGTGATILDFRGAGISTVTVASGIATINITGGGGGGSIGIGTEFPLSSINGDLFFSAEFGRLFIYYDEVTLGIGTDEFWIDAAPFNQGGLFVSKFGDNMFAGLGVTVGSLSSPSVYFNGYTNSGFYSPAANEFGVVVSGTQRLNVNSSGINVTGVATATTLSSTNLNVTNANITGVATATSFKGSAQVGVATGGTYIGLATQFNFVGSGVSVTHAYDATVGIATINLFVEASAGGGGGGDFNTGIASATAYAVTTAMDTAYTAPATAGARHIVHSIHVTNIDGTTSADISGQLYAGEYSIANTIPVPPGSAVELLKQPKILSPSETIQLQSSATGDLHATITIETKAGDTTYIGVGTDITSAATYTDLHIATADTMLQSVLLANDDGVADVKANVVWTDGSNTIQGYYAFEMTIPADATVEILEKPKFLPNGFKVRVLANQANRLEAILSAKTI